MSTHWRRLALEPLEDRRLLSDFYLSFPLPNRTAFTATINAVFDHSMAAPYTADDRVVGYTGETAEAQYGRDYVTTVGGTDLYGFKNATGANFQVNGNYSGGDFLYYDGHPGIDYRTIDQAPDGRIDVLAAAPGTAHLIPGSECNTLYVDHGNGYATYYLHLSERIDALDGQTVGRGQKIGVTGEEGAPGNPHLHFEVRQNVNGQWVSVDPYGWQGPGQDPYTRAANEDLWSGGDSTPAIELIGRWGGEVTDLTVQGTYAYLCQGPSLDIVDVSTPGSPMSVGHVLLDDMTLGIDVVGTTAYVAAFGKGLEIVDVSDPAAPVRIGGYDTPDETQDVEVVGTLAYVADYRAGLQIIDVSDPAGPVWVGEYDTVGGVRGLKVVGVLAYLAAGNGGLQIIDVSDPGAPVWVGGYDTSEHAQDVEIVDTLAYVADDDGGLQIIDVRDPAAPIWVAGYDTGGYVRSVDVVGTLAYLADDSGGLQVVDITDPAVPVWVARYDTRGLAWNVEVVGTLAYVADRSAGLQIIDVSDPTALVWVGEDSSSGPARGIEVVGTLAYVASGPEGLKIIDVSDPAAPAWVGAYDTSGSAWDLKVIGTLAFVADGSAGLQIIDVGDPTAPAWVGAYDTSGLAFDVEVVGTLAYVADWWKGLQIIDVSDPGVPAWVGAYDTSGWALDVDVAGTLAFVADGSAGLQIIDVGDPTAPVRLSEHGVAPGAEHVEVVGGLAYVAASSRGVQIIDVSDAAAPVWVGGYDTRGGARKVEVVGTLAYVADRSAGLQIIDVSDPAAPVWVTEYDTHGSADNVEVLGSFVYVAYGPDGLVILRVSRSVDLAATSLDWDTEQGGVDFGYDVRGADLSEDTTAALYWATGTSVIGAPVYETTIERAVGEYGPYHVPNATLGTRPLDATHVLLVVDPEKVIDESDEENNAQALTLPTPLTVITHGLALKSLFPYPIYQLPDWIYDMATVIMERAKFPYERGEILRSRVPYNTTSFDVPENSSENLLLFDWAEISGLDHPGIADEAEVAGVLTELVQNRLSEVGWRDVHFIGFSRGAFVVRSAMDRLTDADHAKIGFLQMTTLDPQAYGDDGPLDIPVEVDWADNYYQRTPGILEPAGATLPGALNLDLTQILEQWDGRTGLAKDHWEVHDWYHWTIDLTDDGEPALWDPDLPTLPAVDGTDRSDLYPNSDWDEGAKVGHYWSVLGGGVDSRPRSLDRLYVTVDTGDTGQANVEIVENPSPDDVPPGVVEFPVGYFQLTVSDIDPGGSGTLTIYLPPNVIANSYYKFGPTADNAVDHWYEFLFDGTTGAEFLGNTVDVHFVDGQRGDDDLIENGQIFDPGAPAVVPGVSLHGGVLRIIGTNKKDHVSVERVGHGDLRVFADFLDGPRVRRYDGAAVRQIDMRLYDRNDRGHVSRRVHVPAFIDGGVGNDILHGGSGSDILLGGLGRDVLFGGRGRDLIIGGLGADLLMGSFADDILIGGTTEYDEDLEALYDIQAIWTSEEDHDTRVAILRDTTRPTYLKEGETVWNDDSVDFLFGGPARDWLFFDLDLDRVFGGWRR